MSVSEKAKQAVADKAGTKKTKTETMAGYKSDAIATILARYQPQIALALPKHLTAERVIQLATTVVSRNQTLKSCTAESIVGGVMSAATLGLDLNPQFGQCYLIPRRNKNTAQHEANFQIGYRGWLQLLRNSGIVSTVYAEVVREKDLFEVQLGLHPDIIHTPDYRQERGEMIAAYFAVFYKDGGRYFKVLTRKEILARKKRSQAVAAGAITPWDTDEEAMWNKTVVLAAKAFLPVNAEIMDAMASDGATITPGMFDRTTKTIRREDVSIDADEAEYIDESPEKKEPDQKPIEKTTVDKKENQKQPDPVKSDFLESAVPIARIIIDKKGADYFASLMLKIGVNGLDEIPENRQSGALDLLQNEVEKC